MILGYQLDMLVRGCHRSNFVLQSALNFVNLKGQVKKYVDKVQKDLFGSSNAKLQKWQGFAQMWGPSMPI